MRGENWRQAKLLLRDGADVLLKTEDPTDIRSWSLSRRIAFAGSTAGLKFWNLVNLFQPHHVSLIVDFLTEHGQSSLQTRDALTEGVIALANEFITIARSVLFASSVEDLEKIGPALARFCSRQGVNTLVSTASGAIAGGR